MYVERLVLDVLRIVSLLLRILVPDGLFAGFCRLYKVLQGSPVF